MNKIDKTITVIIPAYNVDKYLEKCVMSVEDQDYPKDQMQIIIVDDGSTDTTGEIADKLAAEYANIMSLHKENGGSSSARNCGLKEARGEYVGFVDSDDYISKDMYTNLMEAAISNDADMVQISRDEISEDGEKLKDVVIPPENIKIITPVIHLRDLLLHTGDASFCTKLTKRSLFTEDMIFPEGELNGDFYLMIHILEKVNKLVVLPQQCYHVFYRTGSNSRKKREDRDYFPPVFTDIVRNADVALELVRNNHKELIEVAERFGYVQRLDYLLHIPVSQMRKDNFFYLEVVNNIRRNLGKMLKNKYLTKRQKLYLLILSPAPRLVRMLHAKIRGIS